MYREQIKVLDCTIRDGGLINNHYFTDDFVRAVFLHFVPFLVVFLSHLLDCFFLPFVLVRVDSIEMNPVWRFGYDR